MRTESQSNNRLSQVKAVVFDLDNTITDRDLAFYHFCEYLIDRYISKYPYDKPREELLRFMMEIDKSGYGGIVNFLQGIKKEWGFDLDFDQFMQERVEVFGRLTTARAGINQVLSYLKKKYKLGIITNGSSKMQREKIKYAKVEQYFDDILVSGEFGIDKPATDIFYQCLENFKLKPDEVVYVGDYYKNDIEPSMKVGITPIWLTNHPMQFPEYRGIIISDLMELCHLL